MIQLLPHRLGLLVLGWAVVLAVLAAQAEAAVYITSPDSNTKENGGSSFVVAWRDDDKKPALKNWGNLTIWLATGSQETQFMLQKLANNVRPGAQQAKVKFDPKVGPSSSEYFIRIVGEKTKKDGTQPDSFSGRFRLNKMTGKWSDEIKAALAADTGAGASGNSSSTKGGAAGASSPTGTKSAPSGMTTTTKPGANTTSTSTTARPNTTTSGASASGAALRAADLSNQQVGRLVGMGASLVLASVLAFAVL